MDIALIFALNYPLIARGGYILNICTVNATLYDAMTRTSRITVNDTDDYVKKCYANMPGATKTTMIYE